MKSFAKKWPGLKDFFWFSEMEEPGASEVHKILNYEVLKIQNGLFMTTFSY